MSDSNNSNVPAPTFLSGMTVKGVKVSAKTLCDGMTTADHERIKSLATLPFSHDAEGNEVNLGTAIEATAGQVSGALVARVRAEIAGETAWATVEGMYRQTLANVEERYPTKSATVKGKIALDQFNSLVLAIKNVSSAVAVAELGDVPDAAKRITSAKKSFAQYASTVNSALKNNVPLRETVLKPDGEPVTDGDGEVVTVLRPVAKVRGDTRKKTVTNPDGGKTDAPAEAPAEPTNVHPIDERVKTEDETTRNLLISLATELSALAETDGISKRRRAQLMKRAESLVADIHAEVEKTRDAG